MYKSMSKCNFSGFYWGISDFLNSNDCHLFQCFWSNRCSFQIKSILSCHGVTCRYENEQPLLISFQPDKQELNHFSRLTCGAMVACDRHPPVFDANWCYWGSGDVKSFQPVFCFCFCSPPMKFKSHVRACQLYNNMEWYQCFVNVA